MQYVYLLKSNKDGSKYIGCTGDLKNRLVENNSGKVASTRSKKPLKLVYYEAFLNKYDAFYREMELKHNFAKKRHLMERLKNSLK